MQLITLLQNNSRAEQSASPLEKDSHESDTTSDSSFDQHPDDSPLFFKKSRASTHFTSACLEVDDLEDPEEAAEAQVLACADFFERGHCCRGALCPHSHQVWRDQSCKRKRTIHNQIMANFPSVVAGCFSRRINSFLR